MPQRAHDELRPPARPRRETRRPPRRARWLVGLALAWLLLGPTRPAQGELPLAPVADLERRPVAGGEILDWSGGFAFEGRPWSAAALLAVREERIGAGRASERSVELSLARRLGPRVSLAAGFGLGLEQGGRAATPTLALVCSFEF
jgi:hypothetical protein